MFNHYKHHVKKALFILGLITGYSLHGQHMILMFKNAATERYPVSDIKSIKFEADQMVLNENDDTKRSWKIEDIEMYSFELSSAISVGHEEAMQVRLYPNPVSAELTIDLQSFDGGEVEITIVDGNGRLISEIYKGIHVEKSKYTFDRIQSGSVGAGVYYCKIVTSRQQLIKPFVIQ